MYVAHGDYFLVRWVRGRGGGRVGIDHDGGDGGGGGGSFVLSSSVSGWVGDNRMETELEWMGKGY